MCTSLFCGCDIMKQADRRYYSEISKYVGVLEKAEKGETE